MAAVWFKFAWRAWLSAALPDVVARATSQSMRDAKELCEITFAEILAIQLHNAKNARASLPDWSVDRIKDEWHVKENHAS
jgi:hypothetical protein